VRSFAVRRISVHPETVRWTFRTPGLRRAFFNSSSERPGITAWDLSVPLATQLSPPLFLLTMFRIAGKMMTRIWCSKAAVPQEYKFERFF
jgi:hypothetical protein